MRPPRSSRIAFWDRGADAAPLAGVTVAAPPAPVAAPAPMLDRHHSAGAGACPAAEGPVPAVEVVVAEALVQPVAGRHLVGRGGSRRRRDRPAVAAVLLVAVLRFPPDGLRCRSRRTSSPGVCTRTPTTQQRHRRVCRESIAADSGCSARTQGCDTSWRSAILRRCTRRHVAMVEVMFMVPKRSNPGEMRSMCGDSHPCSPVSGLLSRLALQLTLGGYG